MITDYSCYFPFKKNNNKPSHSIDSKIRTLGTNVLMLVFVGFKV